MQLDWHGDIGIIAEQSWASVWVTLNTRLPREKTNISSRNRELRSSQASSFQTFFSSSLRTSWTGWLVKACSVSNYWYLWFSDECQNLHSPDAWLSENAFWPIGSDDRIIWSLLDTVR
jgi:hypothetical protein